MRRGLLVVAAVAIAAAVTFGVIAHRKPEVSTVVNAVGAPETGAAAASASGSANRRYPAGVHDQAKRDEMRARLAIAIAEANASAASAKEPLAVQRSGQGSSVPGTVRGSRETSDLKEFGHFIQQAIQEDFLPMARACAGALLARDPTARGTATISFKLLGDKNIGGVVDSAEVDSRKSTLQDAEFETCVRESLYSVYFDPPPAGGEATLNFPVVILDDGGIADRVDEFSQLRDRRNEKSATLLRRDRRQCSL